MTNDKTGLRAKLENNGMKYEEQYDATINAINYFKNQIWVIIALSFTLLGGVMWLFDKLSTLQVGYFIALKFIMIFLILFIALVAIILVRCFYIKIDRLRLFEKVISRKRKFYNIDNYFGSDYYKDRKQTFMQGILNCKYILKILKCRYFIELYFTVLIFLSAVLLITYIIFMKPQV